MDEKRPQFGNRFLTNQDNVFQHNAWDDVTWDEEQELEAKTKVEKNSTNRVTEEMKEKYDKDANVFWDEFYSQHQNKFFKDRHWLFTEFPELAGGKTVSSSIPQRAAPDKASMHSTLDDESSGCPVKNSPGTSELESDSEVKDSSRLNQKDVCTEQNKSGKDMISAAATAAAAVDSPFPGAAAKLRFLEVGCGVGNTVMPVLQTNNDPSLFMYACDLSSTAIQILKDHPDYDPGRCHAFVGDITDPDCPVPFPKSSLDLVVLIFVMSAVAPERMQQTVSRLASYLRPGGTIVFRDYGRYDLAQLRFKDGQCLEENFYVRGDGTRVYFFTQEELREMFTAAGLEEVQNLVDRRLQVNRGRQLKMYRVWVQCKYRKPASSSSS